MHDSSGGGDSSGKSHKQKNKGKLQKPDGAAPSSDSNLLHGMSEFSFGEEMMMNVDSDMKAKAGGVHDSKISMGESNFNLQLGADGGVAAFMFGDSDAAPKDNKFNKMRKESAPEGDDSFGGAVTRHQSQSHGGSDAS